MLIRRFSLCLFKYTELLQSSDEDVQLTSGREKRKSLEITLDNSKRIAEHKQAKFIVFKLQQSSFIVKRDRRNS